MAPTGRQAYWDAMLSDFATKNFDTEGMGFIAPRIMGTVSVDKQSANYHVFDPSGFMKVYDDLRSPRAKANKVEWTVSTDAYYAKNRALAGEIPMEDLANGDRALGLRENTTLAIVLGLRRAHEVRVANLATGSGGPGTIVALGANNWNVSTADIMGQVSSAKISVLNSAGMLPNYCLIDYESFQLIRRNSNLLTNYFKSPQAGQISEEAIRSEVLGVPNVIVVNGVKDTTGPGVQQMNLASIWGRICMFFVANPGAVGMDSVNYLTRFRWTNPELPGPYRNGDGFNTDFSVTRTQYDGAGEPHVEVLETGYYQDEKITGSALSYLIKTNSA